jgi:hypothetical protein
MMPFYAFKKLHYPGITKIQGNIDLKLNKSAKDLKVIK